MAPVKVPFFVYTKHPLADLDFTAVIRKFAVSANNS